MKAGVIVAMESELLSLRSSGIEAALSGIGKVNAARCATEMILKLRPDCIINSGCAGSMRPEIGVGDMVVASRCAYHDVWCGSPNPFGVVEGCPRYFESDRLLLDKASSVQLSEGKLFTGLVCSGDQFFVSLEEDERIRSLYPEVLACDMESAAIAQVCSHYGVPFLSFRIISDIHTAAETQKLSYETFWNTIKTNSFSALRQLLDVL
ncbi:MAG: 5'-methylthioadenosine/S-adenosylhomocysteine nucleosidase [Bacteroidales bacterium]|nr:5'-methylthioadenosine/S-adenosylhomocysteine nucleosidase [Bacteroidales bacterium]